MRWKTDQELFADIDENGRLFSDDFTRMMMTGDASKEISTVDSIRYDESTLPLERGNEVPRSACHVAKRVIAYVKKHHNIGSFSSPDITLSIEEWQTRSEQAANPDYNPELANLMNRVDVSKENVRKELLGEAGKHAFEAEGDVLLHTALHMDDAAAEVKREITRRAREEGVTGDVNPYKTVFRSYRKSSYTQQYCFFDYFADAWHNASELHSIEVNKESNKALSIIYLIRIAVWLFVGFCLFLAGNIHWQIANPVSDFLMFIPGGGWIYTLLTLLPLVLVYLLANHNLDGIPLFDITVPIAIFFYPVVFSALLMGDMPQELMTAVIVSPTMQKFVVTVCTVALPLVLVMLLRHLHRRNTPCAWSDVLKAWGIFFLWFWISSTFADALAMENGGPYVMMVLVGLCVLTNLICAICCRIPHANGEEELLNAVNKSALTEYKALRFIWLWINHSNISNKEQYFAAVEQAERQLKEKVNQAEAYAKAKKKVFRME